MRNEDRLGASLEENNRSHSSSKLPLPQTNNIFDFPVPTEFVELPSGGEYYLEGHPLHGVDKIEIKMMTAKEEDILLNQNYIKSGVVVDKLLKSVVMDHKINLDDLLVGDKNALLFATRVSGLGSDYYAAVGCPQCGSSAEEEFDLSVFKTREITIPENVEKTDSHTFMVTLPASKLSVEFRLLDGKAEKVVESTLAKRKKHKLPLNRLAVMLQQMIVSVNGVDNKIQINQLIEKLPAKDVRYLRKSYEAVSPDLDLSYTHVCGSCDKEQEVMLPMTADFFWSNR